MKSILKTKNTTNKDKEEPSTPYRITFLADLHVTTFVTYYELSFEVQGSLKPIQAVQIPLIRIIDKVQQFDSQFRVIKYVVLVQTNKSGVAVKLDQVMKEVPLFIK